MLLGFSLKVSGTVAELFLPLILTHILENVIVTLSLPSVLIYGLVMLLCAGVACCLNIVANRMAAKVSMEFSRELRKRLFTKTLYLSARDMDGFTVPSLESRITTDTYNVHHFVGMMQRMGVRAPILMLGGMTISFIMDPYLASVMLVMLPFIFLIIFYISKKGIPLYAEVQKRVDGMVRVVREDVQGIRVIKALSKGDYERERYEKVNLALSKKERHAGTVMGVVNPTMTALMNLGIAGVVMLCAVGVEGGITSPAKVIAFMQYFTLISMAMMTLSRVFVAFTKCAASANRIAEVLDAPERPGVDGSDESPRADACGESSEKAEVLDAPKRPGVEGSDESPRADACGESSEKAEVTECAKKSKVINAAAELDGLCEKAAEGAENGEKLHTPCHIEMRGVSFSYLGRKKNLENISFKINRGERLGIIGATGSGKSTLISLLLRFYEADEGEILIGGRRISSYEREELSNMLGVVLQSDFLYSDTIEENIKFGRDIPHECVEWAARIAQAHEFITEKEGGYGYVMAPKGTDLSGGQRQRLLIARAVAASPDILILDDSSSALDYKTDANLRRAISEGLPHSTVITVAQRVSSVKDCDLILVLDEGRIIGMGRHEELLLSCGEYKEISDSQMGGAIIE